jgi:hypothetical protein
MMRRSVRMITAHAPIGDGHVKRKVGEYSPLTEGGAAAGTELQVQLGGLSVRPFLEQGNLLAIRSPGSRNP